MKLKLDENLGRSVAERLRGVNHDVATVQEQAMGGSTDDALFEACRNERRMLVTLDLDFADPRRFDPTASAGIAVLRVPMRPGHGHIDAVVSELLRALERVEHEGVLLIVEPGRVRRYESPTE